MNNPQLLGQKSSPARPLLIRLAQRLLPAPLRSWLRARRERDRRAVTPPGVHPGSRLGRATSIGFGTRINGPAFIQSEPGVPVSIGRYCAIAHNLRIRTHNHDTRYANVQVALQQRHGFPQLRIGHPVIIGNAVWIGDNVSILPGVTIGDGAVIGAGAVVTRDIPAFAVAAGVPARPLRPRFEESVSGALLEISWWNWSAERIDRNRALFSTDLTSYAGDVRELVVP